MRLQGAGILYPSGATKLPAFCAFAVGNRTSFLDFFSALPGQAGLSHHPEPSRTSRRRSAIAAKELISDNL